jgi:hypothetical protein
LGAVNLSGFIGSLFSACVLPAVVIYESLDLLVEMLATAGRFESLCAMHALIVQADDKLGNANSASFIKNIRHKLNEERTAFWSEEVLIDVRVSE